MVSTSFFPGFLECSHPGLKMFIGKSRPGNRLGRMKVHNFVEICQYKSTKSNWATQSGNYQIGTGMYVLAKYDIGYMEQEYNDRKHLAGKKVGQSK